MLYLVNYTFTFQSDIFLAFSQKHAKNKAIKMIKKNYNDCNFLNEIGKPISSYDEVIETIEQMSLCEWLMMYYDSWKDTHCKIST